ncbi:MAG: NERD domain-containing protein [Candidatus Aenigmarchaeota archaeon]|nr:NERD domain-containing protein [Candidatus Aenigmarchaeota archaeon]
MSLVPDLERISRQVLRGKSIEDAVGKFDWQEFERIVGDIFRQNDFRVSNNFRFKTGRRWEVDLVAVRGGTVFCVDCKRWSAGRPKKWGIAKAAREQEKRTKAMGKFFRSNVIARSLMGIPNGRFVPMMATLHEEEVVREGQTFVVPVKKLNSFIVQSDELL